MLTLTCNSKVAPSMYCSCAVYCVHCSLQTQPGLGLDETYYAWIVAAYSIGEFFSALAFSVAANYFKVKNLMMTVTFSLLVGSLLYGTGVSGWMLVVGRCLQGVYSGGGSTLFRIYIGETSNMAMELKGEDKSKSQLKNTNFFIAFGFGTLATGLGPGESVCVLETLNHVVTRKKRKSDTTTLIIPLYILVNSMYIKLI